ncbi:MAG: hypothetical protein PWQ60_1675 [Thermoanaerobacteraceae bacterium]|nr:hypothetical protein [Thermoanaerobacteraceae bacterium]
MSLKVVCCGMQAKKIADVATKVGESEVEVSVMPDMQGAQGVKTGKFDYYIGTCQTGGGGSLGMAIAILGPQKSKIVATPGRVPKYEDIVNYVKSGVKAFGLPYDQIDGVVPMIIKAILEQR